jgi:hypothetical protein
MKTAFLKLISKLKNSPIGGGGAFLLLFLSCTKEEATPSLPAIPMVKTEELKSFTQGTLASHTKSTYSYDTQQRVVAIAVQNMLDNSSNTVTYDYSTPNQVKVGGRIYVLDVNGRATQLQYSPQYVENFTYDANGYLLTSSDPQFNKTYTYANNNLTEIKTFYTAQNQLFEQEKFSFGTQPNTIGNENKGMKFLGKSSANFIGGRQKVYGQPLYNYTYTSNYDTQNRLTDYYWSRIGGNQAGTFQAFYTYYP